MATLALRCELLTGVYQAADPFGGPGDGEWPPHPFRLHAALLASACERGGEAPDPDDVAVLRWLERQGAPAISCAPKAVARDAPLAFVPRNPLAIEFARARDNTRKSGRYVSAWQRNGRRFPARVPEDPVITYQWPAVADIPSALERLATGVCWLGSSRSPVGCALDDSPPPATLAPGGGRGQSLRVAGPGTTDAMLASRHVWPTTVEPPIASYTDRTAVAVETQRDRPNVFGTLLVRGLRRTRPDLRSAGVVCAALRAAVLSHAGDEAPAALHGHGDAPHAAYLALGDVGRSHATGLIVGVALALPAELDAEARAACGEAFSAVGTFSLGRDLAPLHLDDEATASALRPERWIGPSRQFSTATPVILDRFPRRGRTAEDELARSLAYSGFTGELERVEVLAGPAVRGGALVGGLDGELPPGRRVHARITFAEPVRGPIVAGRGRFRGVGLFVPTDGRS